MTSAAAASGDASAQPVQQAAQLPGGEQLVALEVDEVRDKGRREARRQLVLVLPHELAAQARADARVEDAAEVTLRVHL